MKQVKNGRTWKLLIAACLLLVTCGVYLHFFGDGARLVTEKGLGTSAIFSEEDRRAAMTAVQTRFEADFPGCTLTKLWYDEDASNLEAEDWTVKTWGYA